SIESSVRVRSFCKPPLSARDYQFRSRSPTRGRARSVSGCRCRQDGRAAALDIGVRNGTLASSARLMRRLPVRTTTCVVLMLALTTAALSSSCIKKEEKEEDNQAGPPPPPPPPPPEPDRPARATARNAKKRSAAARRAKSL